MTAADATRLYAHMRIRDAAAEIEHALEERCLYPDYRATARLARLAEEAPIEEVLKEVAGLIRHHFPAR